MKRLCTSLVMSWRSDDADRYDLQINLERLRRLAEQDKEAKSPKSAPAPASSGNLRRGRKRHTYGEGHKLGGANGLLQNEIGHADVDMASDDDEMDEDTDSGGEDGAPIAIVCMPMDSQY